MRFKPPWYLYAFMAYAVIPDGVDVVAEAFLLTCIQETATSFPKSSLKKYIALCPSRKAEEDGLFCKVNSFQKK